MKKIVTLILVVIMLLCVLCACGNKMLFDTTYNYKYAYVVWPDGTAEKLEISGWIDYEGEQLQIKTKDGDVYLFSSINCVLGTD